jgi:hypothetical protein
MEVISPHLVIFLKTCLKMYNKSDTENSCLLAYDAVWVDVFW